MTREQVLPYVSFCVDDDGRIIGYHGVPFGADYLRKAVKANGVYGVLDYFYAGETAPKLFELGLEAGQQWLLYDKYGAVGARSPLTRGGPHEPPRIDRGHHPDSGTPRQRTGSASGTR